MEADNGQMIVASGRTAAVLAPETVSTGNQAAIGGKRQSSF